MEGPSRGVREEQLHWVALGTSQVRKVEAPGRHGLATYALRGLGWLHSLARGKHLIYQHFSMHVKLLAEAHQQKVNFYVRVIGHVLHTEAQCRASIAACHHAVHRIVVDCIARRKALVQEDAPPRRMYGVAAHRVLCICYEDCRTHP